jgi:TRAP-type uncharacterized transport system fused permease subunit
MMFWLKSILVAAAATIAAVLAVCMVGIAAAGWLARKHEGQEGLAVGFDPVSLFRQSSIPWLILLAVFAVTFYWQYRRH